MSIFKSVASAALVAGFVSGCATVRQQDLDAWVGAPVEALDAHPLFLTMPVYRAQTASGVETRNYVNSREVEQCFTSHGARRGDGKYVSHTAFTTCSESSVACNNLFYIQGGKVIRYVPTGACYTNDSVRPNIGYLTPKPVGQ
ncbi:hypothetical protein VAPA_2c08480 [Variovorax paradoxus B4]|uniref:Lipoprotein n=1 Tax=Variovorax paradoxus B4 TaxID=1246301 RepID=T1XM71_VARPD|nr:hypothetical protein [Variovorax paradoxus]AGU53404.1 hypothetical protein VAPA_2c08480 [Variovorax paradoxus B4]